MYLCKGTCGSLGASPDFFGCRLRSVSCELRIWDRGLSKRVVESGMSPTDCYVSHNTERPEDMHTNRTSQNMAPYYSTADSHQYNPAD